MKNRTRIYGLNFAGQVVNCYEFARGEKGMRRYWKARMKSWSDVASVKIEHHIEEAK